MNNYLVTNYQIIDGVKKKCIKVGKTDKQFSGKRGSGYDCHNGPGGYVLLGLKKTESDMFERFMHIKYKHLRLRNPRTGYLTEWCLWNQKMIDDFFTETEKSLGEFLWENRGKYLTKYQGIEKKAKEYLREKYGNRVGISQESLKKVLEVFIESKGKRIVTEDKTVREYLSLLEWEDVTTDMTLEDLRLDYCVEKLSRQCLSNVNKLKKND